MGVKLQKGTKIVPSLILVELEAFSITNLLTHILCSTGGMNPF